MKVREKLFKYVQNEQGIALVVVLIVLVVISVLGLGLMGLTLNNAKMSSNERNHQSVYYIAEAGATKALNEISKEVTCPPNLDKWNGKEYSFEESFGETPVATIEIGQSIKDVNLYTYNLISTGKIGNSNRTVYSTFTLNCGNNNNQDQEDNSNVPIEILSDLAVFSNGKMNLTSTVTGNIGTNSSAAGSIYIDWGMADYKGIINLPPGIDSKIVKTAYTMNGFKPTYRNMSETRNYTLPAFPVYPEGLPLYPNILLKGNMRQTINLNEDRFYNEIKLTANTTLTLHLNEDRVIRVKKLDMPQGHIILTGNGKLTLYIDDEIYMSGGSTINKNDASGKLNIFYKGSKKVNLANDIKITGSLFTKISDIYLGGSGAITGHILSGGSNITVDGGSNLNSRVILAPHAFVHVKNGTVKGSIIADTFTIDGGGKVYYEDFGEDELVPYYPPKDPVGPSDSTPILEPGPIREQG